MWRGLRILNRHPAIAIRIKLTKKNPAKMLQGRRHHIRKVVPEDVGLIVLIKNILRPEIQIISTARVQVKICSEYRNILAFYRCATFAFSPEIVAFTLATNPIFLQDLQLIKTAAMRKLILRMAMTVDGFVCGPNGEMNWFVPSDDQSIKDMVERSLWDAGVHIMGRRSFESMGPYWITSSDQLAEPMNKIPKVVFSKGGYINRLSYDKASQTISPYAATWTDAPVATDLITDITALKQQEGKPILAHGGAGFAQELVKHGLVDEYRLIIHPVAIGKGISVFATALHRVNLALVSSTPYSSGAIVNIYTPKKG